MGSSDPVDYGYAGSACDTPRPSPKMIVQNTKGLTGRITFNLHRMRNAQRDFVFRTKCAVLLVFLKLLVVATRK
jgi:hypothetical protein